MTESVKGLLAFLKKSPTCFHAVETIRERLLTEGYAPLEEGKFWKLTRGGKYFVTRNRSSILSFRIPQGDFTGFQVAASHCDSPTFKIKENPDKIGRAHV